MRNNSPTLHMLLLSADPGLVSAFTAASSELGIEAQSSNDGTQVSDQLNRAKYEGVVLDLDTVSSARSVLANVRKSRSNKNAIVFAVATNKDDTEHVLRERAHFLLRRPLDSAAIRETLDTAYNLMLGEGRRRFRCAVTLPI